MSRETVRAVVEVSERHIPRARLWGYGYADLAALLNLDEGTLRHWVSAGTFDPGDLEALVRMALLRRPDLAG